MLVRYNEGNPVVYIEAADFHGEVSGDRDTPVVICVSAGQRNRAGLVICSGSKTSTWTREGKFNTIKEIDGDLFAKALVKALQSVNVKPKRKRRVRKT